MSLTAIDQMAALREAAVPHRPGRILLLSTSLGLRGGAEEQVQQLGLQLKSRGWTVGFISMLRPRVLMPELLDPQINIGTLDMKRGFTDARRLVQMVRIVRSFRPDILHSHMTHANLLARVIRPFARVPVLVCTLHGAKMHSVKGGSRRFRELAHRFTDRWADITTTTCHASAETSIQHGAVPAGKVMVLPDGIDTERYRPRPEIRNQMRATLGVQNKFVWLAVGRFELPKNYGLMIRAFALALQTSRRDMLLLICGDGSLMRPMKGLTRKLGLERNVRFLGIRRDIADVMNAADAYVMSSDTEGLSMPLLQASASGLPIVATAVGGNAEIVQHNRTGFLVPRGDAKELAAAIERTTCLNAFDRAQLGGAGRQYTHDNFGIAHVVDLWEQLYHRLLTHHAAFQREANS